MWRAYKNFIPEAEFLYLQNYVVNIEKYDRVNVLDWPKNVVLSSHLILCKNSYKCSDEIKKIIDKTIQKIIFVLEKEFGMVKKTDENPLKISADFFKYHPGSYIPWHTDSDHKYAATLYFNDNWNRDWGGLTLMEYGTTRTFIIPERNNIFILKGDFWHTVSSLTSDAQPRYTLQIFIGD